MMARKPIPKRGLTAKDFEDDPSNPRKDAVAMWGSPARGAFTNAGSGRGIAAAAAAVAAAGKGVYESIKKRSADRKAEDATESRIQGAKARNADLQGARKDREDSDSWTRASARLDSTYAANKKKYPGMKTR
jgi:hypothetical protein